MLVTDKNLESCISKIKEAKYCSLDTESTGLEIHGRDNLFAISICTDLHEVFYFDFRNYSPRSALKELSKALKPPKLVFLANAKFDMHLLHKEGVTIDSDVCDVLILDKLIYNSHAEYSLKAVASRWGESKSEEVDKYIKDNDLYEVRDGTKSPRFDLVPRDILQEYAEKDAYITLKIAEKQLAKVAEMDASFPDSKLSQVVAFEGLVTKTCFKIEQTGMKIDRDYILRAIDFEKNRAINLLSRYKELTGYDFIDSNKHIAHVFSLFGLKGGITEKGNPSFTKNNIGKINHEIARIIESYRDSVKRVSTYYEAFLKSATNEDRVHPNIRQAGADTFRFSVTSPALQTLNKKDDGIFKVRNCFVASEGFKLVAVDFAQQEYRLTADYAGETELINSIKSGIDVHTATAQMMGTDRTTAKTLNFMLLYGGGTQKLADSLKISFEEADKLKKAYFRNLPNISRLIKKASSTAKTRGWIYNTGGYRLQFSDPQFAYKATNYLIQSSGAYIMRQALVHLQEYLIPFKSRIVMTIHDEILFEVHEDELDIIPHLRSIMRESYTPKNGLGMDTSLAIGDRWGELHEQEE